MEGHWEGIPFFLARSIHKSISFCYFNSAYKQNFSAETLLTKITSDILLDMNNRNLTMLVLINLSAAYDTFDHF